MRVTYKFLIFFEIRLNQDIVRIGTFNYLSKSSNLNLSKLENKILGLYTYSNKYIPYITNYKLLKIIHNRITY